MQSLWSIWLKVSFSRTASVRPRRTRGLPHAKESALRAQWSAAIAASILQRHYVCTNCTPHRENREIGPAAQGGAREGPRGAPRRPPGAPRGPPEAPRGPRGPQRPGASILDIFGKTRFSDFFGRIWGDFIDSGNGVVPWARGTVGLWACGPVVLGTPIIMISSYSDDIIMS